MKLGFDYGNVLIQSALIDMYGKMMTLKNSVFVFQSSLGISLKRCNSMMSSLLYLGVPKICLCCSVGCCDLLHRCAIKLGFDFDIMVLLEDFEAFPSPNIIGFTSINNAYARKGMGSECLGLFEEIIQKGVKPDEVTFLCMLLGCNHSGLVEEGKRIFESMRLHGVFPDRRHYSCMVGLLGRAGLVIEAEELLNHASSTGDSVVWSSLLRSCRIHQNEHVGRRATIN
ncbi:pentatricopeptide repeat-containing protein At2g37320-like [Nicotiana sylvestris]|uniref:pentatricopeptide repeat-containing protein At2g37320-like n=1 Tax=Nicotiana sylvestris TaxID=4096 RepID=UPI00388C42C9